MWYSWSCGLVDRADHLVNLDRLLDVAPLQPDWLYSVSVAVRRLHHAERLVDGLGQVVSLPSVQTASAVRQARGIVLLQQDGFTSSLRKRQRRLTLIPRL
jgi:hypothetical protein